MVSLGEVFPDAVLSSLYVYILIRIGTASERHFKTPFYIFFVSTGVYSVITVVAYQLIMLISFSEQFWTYHFYKILVALNAFGSVGATFGKAAVAVHRYYVLRSRDFSEKGLSGRIIIRVLLVQFIISLLETVSIWPAGHVYRIENGIQIIAGISRIPKLIQKALAVANYVIYIICNSIFTVLSSRELYRMKGMIEEKTNTSRMLMAQQRNMFIVVTVCSLSHLFKAVHQSLIFAATQFELVNLNSAVAPLYPLVNGLATYAAPICLVLLSSRLRERLTFARRRKITILASPTIEISLAKF